jgi:TonB-dependent SusC/RagA subfamily outer membrane receptor
MKRTLLFFQLLFLAYFVNATINTDYLARIKQTCRQQVSDTFVPFRFHCASTRLSSEPLMVIDGEITSVQQLKQVNVQEIESITILKEENAAALYGSRGINGVIIITRKSKYDLVISDSVDGKPIEAATVKIYTLKEKRDSTIMITDDNGIVDMNGIDKNAVKYIVVSRVGYKTEISTLPLNGRLKEFKIRLARDIKPLEQITVTGYLSWCRRMVCCCFGVRVNNNQSLSYEVKKPGELQMNAFPNPVLRNSSVTICLSQPSSGKLQLINASGQVVSESLIQQEAGRQIHLALRGISPGLYFIQFIDSGSPKPLRFKIIVQ